MALLSFVDALEIYHNFNENHLSKGVCLANIGSIMMQAGDNVKAKQYFEEAI